MREGASEGGKVVGEKTEKNVASLPKWVFRSHFMCLDVVTPVCGGSLVVPLYFLLFTWAGARPLVFCLAFCFFNLSTCTLHRLGGEVKSYPDCAEGNHSLSEEAFCPFFRSSFFVLRSSLPSLAAWQLLGSKYVLVSWNNGTCKGGSP